jgi:predicted nuclease of restriction endonuclease-like (RecB) superfamily
MILKGLRCPNLIEFSSLHQYLPAESAKNKECPSQNSIHPGSNKNIENSKSRRDVSLRHLEKEMTTDWLKRKILLKSNCKKKRNIQHIALNRDNDVSTSET